MSRKNYYGNHECKHPLQQKQIAFQLTKTGVEFCILLHKSSINSSVMFAKTGIQVILRD